MLSKYSETAKIMLLALAVILAVLAALGLVVTLAVYPFEKPLAYVLGLLVGGGLSAMKILLLERSIAKTVDMEQKNAQSMARLHFFLRYGLTVLVLVGVVLLRQYIGLFGTLLGLLALQLSAYAANAVELRREKKRFALYGPPPPLTDEDENEEDAREEDMPPYYGDGI